MTYLEMAEMLLGVLGMGDNVSPILASVPFVLSDSVSMISRRNLCPSYVLSLQCPEGFDRMAEAENRGHH